MRLTLRVVKVEGERIGSKSDGAEVVEGEAAEHILEVERLAGVCGGGEEGEEAVTKLRANHVGDEGLERASGELAAGGLALEGPEVAVGVEDAVAEEVGEGGAGAVAFGVIGEVGAEEVLDDEWVGGADATGEAEGAPDLDGGGRGGGEEAGDPVEEAVAVAEEGDEVAEEGMGEGAVVGGFGGLAEEEVKDDGGEDGDGES